MKKLKLSFKFLLMLLGFGLTVQAQFTCPEADYNPGNNVVQISRYYPNIAIPTAYKQGKITCTYSSSPTVIPLISAVKVNGVVQTNIVVGGPSNVFYVGTGKNPPLSLTKTQQISIEDTTAPIASAQDITVQLDANGSVSITADDINYGSSDACGIANLSISKTTFNCSNVGANTVTLTVTDVNGNSANANAVVTVRDNINPTAICKNASVTLVAGSASITAANINNGSSDACGIATLSVSPSSFTCANIGNNNVVLTVTDVNGNVSTCNAVVQVLGSIPSCSISSSPRNNGTVIGSTTTLAPANTLYLGYGAQTCGSLKNSSAVGDLYTEGDVDLIVYPNPSTTSFTFKLESESNEPIQITILDINGKLITQSTYEAHAESVVVGDELANGMYIAIVKQGDFNKTIKIQKIQ